MIREALNLYMKGGDPELRGLHRATSVVFCLWVFDTFVGTYSGCKILQFNSLVMLNMWVSLAAGVLCIKYCRAVSMLAQCGKSNQAGHLVGPQEHSSLVVEQEEEQSQQGVSFTFDEVDGFCFGARRLQTLTSFAIAVFVLFGCFTVFIEAIHHLKQPQAASPKMLLFSGVIHLFVITLYGAEIDLYDRISGVNFVQHEQNGLPTLHFSARQLMRRPQLLFSKNFIQQSKLVHCAVRAFAALSCTLLSLMEGVCGGSYLEIIGALALGCYIGVVAFRRMCQMSWLLLNNAVRHPGVAAKCERAIRSVQLISGVMQVKSSCFWEVSEGENMALVRLILLSSAKPSSVTAEAHRILSSVATYVFVEVRQHDEHDDYDVEEDRCGHGPNHSHSHSHSHGNGNSHDHGIGHGVDDHLATSAGKLHVAGSLDDVCVPNQTTTCTGSGWRSCTVIQQ